MKHLILLSLILIFSVTCWSQQTDSQIQVPEKTQKAMLQGVQSVRNSAQQLNTINNENKNQENVIDYQQALQSPRKVRGKMVQNTVSGDKKVRVKFGSAYDSGPKQTLEKKSEKSKCTQAELKKALSEDNKLEPARIMVDQE